MQGAQLNDTLGVTTPGRFTYSGGVYYYNNLTTTDPVSEVPRDLELGLTREASVRAAVENFLDAPLGDPRNVPGMGYTEYGECLVTVD